MARLILDTGVLVAAERGKLDLAPLRDHDMVIAAVTAAELLTGVERADTRERRERRQGFADLVFATVPVEDYTLEVARVHARMLAHTRRLGEPRGAHDLMIAATAVATARSVHSLDGEAGFGELPGVRLFSGPGPRR
ncbi:PIN domain-containing protein [Streptomyces sp. MUM 203J]|uniref:PIN domain-containing protein n=1 Tax=Streptomyces sp. MUM 203J TaxID=2791990 RepID=UPI001F043EC8|nr:PIN domain-containing protein [Streptomyces sp. MUM 203J]MCH0538523.1 PIN domain-containing protein [Streptomyces sp. MUM 203J]